jgi:hypothetical protein
MDVRNNDNVGTPSARVYEDALHLAKALEDGADIGLEGRIANVMVVAEDPISVAFSCEEGGSKVGMMGNKPCGKDGQGERSECIDTHTGVGPTTCVSGFCFA